MLVLLVVAPDVYSNNNNKTSSTLTDGRGRTLDLGMKGAERMALSNNRVHGPEGEIGRQKTKIRGQVQS